MDRTHLPSTNSRLVFRVAPLLHLLAVVGFLILGYSADHTIHRCPSTQRIRALPSQKPSSPQPAQGDQAAVADTWANALTLLSSMRASCSRYDILAAGESVPVPPGSGVSVVIGAYARPTTLRMILDSLGRQRGVDVETIVVDAGTEPPVLSTLPVSASRVVNASLWRASDGKYHRVRSFNEGAALARHDIVVLLDDDVVPASDYWALSAVHAFALDPGASIARLPVHILEFKADLADAPIRQELVAAFDGWPEAYPGFTSVNMAIKRSAWQSLGGFDMKLDGRYGGDDQDLHGRAGAKGMRYTRARPYGCALHVGVFYGNRGLDKGK